MRTQLLALFLLSCSSPPTKPNPPATQAKPSTTAAASNPIKKEATFVWKKATGIPPIDLLAVSFVNDKEASVVGDIGPGNGPILHTQNAGETWIVGTTTAEILTDVSFDAKQGAVVGYAGHIAVSEDAARSWKVIHRDENTILRGVARYKNTIVAVGDQALWVSTDAGKTLNAIELKRPLELQDVILWSETESAAVSSDGDILITNDLWKSHKETDANGAPFFSVARTQHNVCGAGPDSINCVNQEMKVASRWNELGLEFFDIAFDGNKGVAVGAAGTLYTSSNGGADWKKEDPNTKEDLFAVAIRGQHIIAVGAKGTIVYRAVVSSQ
jgi:photosystem II stability/assembly factor-like uncharacterized protein